MKVQTVGENPTTIEVEPQEDGTLLAEDGSVYKVEHESSVFTFVSKVEEAVEGAVESAEAKIESEIEQIEEKVAETLPGVTEVSEETGDDSGSADEVGTGGDVPVSHEGGGADGPPSPEPEAV